MSDDPAARRGTRPRLYVGLLLVAVAAAHLPGLHTGFLSDDYMILAHLERSSVVGELTRPFLDLRGVLFYRPFLTGTFALDHAVWGLNPFGFHVTSLLLHLLVTLLVFEVARALSGRWLAGWLAAALIGFHPLNPNTVFWIAGRSSLVGSFFALLAIAAFLAHRRKPCAGMKATVIAATCIGFFGKESLMALPLFLLVADRVLPGRPVAWRFHAALWITLGLYLVARFAVLGKVLGGYGAPIDVPLARRGLDFVASLPRALGPLTFAGWFEGVAWLPFVVLVGWLVLLARWFARGRPGGRGVLVAGGFALGMALAFYASGWVLLLANAERWYPAFCGVVIVLAIIATGAGRIGFVFACAVIVAGLPGLVGAEFEYRRAGADCRRIIAAVERAPSPVFALNVPLIHRGAPFLHFGLADSVRPPFQPLADAAKEVLTLHAPYTNLADGPNPAPWLMARAGDVHAIWLDAEARPVATVNRAALLAYPAFAAYAALPTLDCDIACAGTSFDVVVRDRAGHTVEWFVFAPIAAGHGVATVGANGEWRGSLGATLVDHLTYSGTTRVFFTAIARDAAGRVTALCGRWVATGG